MDLHYTISSDSSRGGRLNLLPEISLESPGLRKRQSYQPRPVSETLMEKLS
jgi:hypothetical protein